MRLFIVVSSFAIVVVCIRSLRVLQTQFPAFGVLFDTLARCKNDMFFFLIA